MIDKSFQDHVLACLLRVPEFNMAAKRHLQPSYFEGVIENNLAKMILDYSKRYDSPPGEYELSIVIIDMAKVKKKIKVSDASLYTSKVKELKAIDVSGWRFILEKLINFIKHARMRQLIMDATTKHMPKEDFVTIEKGMREIAAITLDATLEPYDYFSLEKIEERKVVRVETAKLKRYGISTGIKKMDDHLYHHGFWGKELYVFMAGPKRGKTMAMLWFSNVAAIQGHVVAHFTCEVSREICTDRLDAMNAEIRARDLVASPDSVMHKLKSLGVKGDIKIFEYPTKSLPVAEVDRQVERLQAERGVKVDMIVVDYLDILKPTHRYADSPWQEQAGIAEELRGLACKYNVPVVTATQVNRKGAGKMIVHGSDVAGSFEKVMVADEIITLSATDKEITEGILRVHFSESRNSGLMTFTIKTDFEFGKFYSEFIEEEK